MENLKKKPCLFLTMSCVTIVDAGIIINKHIKLNEWVQLKPIYKALEDYGLFQMKTEIEKNEIFSSLCEFMSYDIQIEIIGSDDNLFLGVFVSRKKITQKKEC
jgi:hypothetical protein